MYSKEDLFAKIDWEGGVVAALEYGIRSKDIQDPELRMVWGTVEIAWDELLKAVNRVEAYLED